ncbi:MAG: hypothetical protein JO142_08275 [Burkholderiales bacterium]|nr:hypothetical protein [Burkholderiales bacterium]
MRTPFIYPASSLPTPLVPPTLDAAEQTIPGFEVWLAQAMASEPAAADAEMQYGPADFGLWGVAPDGDGRLDLDEVTHNLKATLTAFAINLGKACRAVRLTLPPVLRIEAGPDGGMTLPFDNRAELLGSAIISWPALAHQFRRLMAGFGFVRCGASLRAWQTAIGRMGPNRLALGMHRTAEHQTAPRLSLVYDGQQAWPEEIFDGRWRPLAQTDQLVRELLEAAGAAPRYRSHDLPLDQALDLTSIKLRAARER